jgi:hypothetical protein
MATQGQVDAALISYQEALNQQSKYKTLYIKAKNALDECQAARDAKSGGYFKNQACPISSLEYYNDSWKRNVDEMNIWISTAADRKYLYDSLKEEWDSQQQTIIDVNASDPETAQAQEETEQAQIAADTEKTLSKDKTKKALIIGGVVLASVVLIVLLWKR